MAHAGLLPGFAELRARVSPDQNAASGFDPDITEAGALVQVDRVAAARHLDPAKVRALVEKHVEGRILWVFGEPHVNVLDVNMALDNGEAS